MSHPPPAGPIARLTRKDHHRWLESGWIVLACLIVFVSTWSPAGLPRTTTTPTGIELELAGTADGALAVMRAMDDARNPDGSDPHDLDRARTAIYWDFLLILSYALGLTTLLEWLAAKDPEKADILTPYAAWGALLAASADVFENIAMLIMLAEYGHNPRANLGLPALFGTIASLTKWTVLFAVVGYSSWEIAKRIARLFKGKKSDDAPTPTPVPQPPAPQGRKKDPYREDVLTPDDPWGGKKKEKGSKGRGEPLPM